MAFTVQDYTDLVRLLLEHPEWRLEIRQLVLSEELLSLPEIVRELAEAQRRTEERLGRLEGIVAELAEAQRRTEARVAELAEAQRRTEERLDRLEGIVAELAEAQRRTEERLDRLEGIVAELTEAQRRAEERLDRLEERVARLEETVQNLIEQMATLVEQVRSLTEAQHHMSDTLGRLKGQVMELNYRHRAGAFLGPFLRRIQVVDPVALEDALEAALTPGEFRDLLRLDLLLKGSPRQRPEVPEIWLAVEVSAVVDRTDIDRAERRASLLRKAGFPALPVAAGEEATRGAEDSAALQKVILVQDGQVSFWEEALGAWLA
jgi:uncharacterized coiled-coil protein SlyX